MGLICDTTTSSPWKDPIPSPPSIQTISTVDFSDHLIRPITTRWDDVAGLEDQQKKELQKLNTKGILWKHPANQNPNPNDENSFPPVVFRLSHGVDVEADGNCLFTASCKAMGMPEITAVDLRRRTVKRFLEDFESVDLGEKEEIDSVIRNMYVPDLKCGWGVHFVQEVKLLAKISIREDIDFAIDELVDLGIQRELAAEFIYNERCIVVNNGANWAKYMSISGSPEEEYNIITLQYTEEGLLTVDENRDGRAAAFGDDIAIECLATEFKREIFVVQAHGSDAIVDEENCVFFLPHRPRSEICGLPFFLFMKGTGWCGAGADHYEPLIAHTSSAVSHEKVAMVL